MMTISTKGLCDHLGNISEKNCALLFTNGNHYNTGVLDVVGSALVARALNEINTEKSAELPPDFNANTLHRQLDTRVRRAQLFRRHRSSSFGLEFFLNNGLCHCPSLVCTALILQTCCQIPQLFSTK